VVDDTRLYHTHARAGRTLALSWRRAVNVTFQEGFYRARHRSYVSGSCGCLRVLSVQTDTGGEQGGDVLVAGRDMRYVSDDVAKH
jgi:hypothetical protein